MNSGDQKLITDYKTWLDQKEMIARFFEYSDEELKEQKINLDSMIDKANEMERSLSERSSTFSSGYSQTEITFDDVVSKLNTSEAVVEIIQFNEHTNRFTEEVKYLMLIGKKIPEHPESVVIENGSQLNGRYFSY